MAIRSRLVTAAFSLLSLSLAAQTPAPSLTDKFFDSNGVRIRYVERGQGTPIVLIHGYTGTLDRHWINPGVFDELAKGFRVIAMDARGHGKSDKPHDPKAYGSEMGQDVVRLLDHLGIRRAHIMGYSMGAIIAAQLLTTNADRFITASLVAHPAVRKFTAADREEAEASARELEGDTPFKSLVVGLWPAGTPLPSDEEIRKITQALIAGNDLKALAAYNRGRTTLVATDAQLAATRVPTLGIIGTADPSAQAMRELTTVMPQLKLVIVDGAEHGGERGILRRKEFLPAVREFLRAQE